MATNQPPKACNLDTVRALKMPHPNAYGDPCPDPWLNVEPGAETAYCHRCGAIAGRDSAQHVTILGHGSPAGTTADTPHGRTFGGYGA